MTATNLFNLYANVVAENWTEALQDAEGVGVKLL